MEDRLDELEYVVSTIDDAASALRGIGRDLDADNLVSIMAEVQAEIDEIEAQMEAEAAADRAALEREYWRDKL